MIEIIVFAPVFLLANLSHPVGDHFGGWQGQTKTSAIQVDQIIKLQRVVDLLSFSIGID